jgi:hypothetical protein
VGCKAGEGAAVAEATWAGMRALNAATVVSAANFDTSIRVPFALRARITT